MVSQLEDVRAALGDRYRLEHELGSGGMATVYLAEDLKHRRRVAIKILHAELAMAVGPQRFRREIEIVANLTHPHILPLLDSGEAAESLYYAMPYVSGESLRQRLSREQQLSVEEAVRIASEVAGALDYAHRSGIVHRDVKPENILLVDGLAVLADFGIARAISRAGETLTSFGQALGTAAYISPEQASAETNIDGRADLYSLGCVLYEMLAGEPPFTGPTAQAVIAKRMIQPAPSVRVVRDGIPEALDRVLRRLLSRAPSDRYRTAEALRRALRTAADAPARSPRKRRITRRTSERAIESIAVLPFENLSRDPEQEYFVAGMHDAIIGQLGQIASLRVASRTSATQLQRTGKTIPDIARTLKVDAVIEGSVLTVGDRLRIQVELIQAAPREQYVWGQTYDRDQRDVLALHNDLARAVARAIRVKLKPDERKRLRASQAVVPEAYRHFLIANFQLGKYTETAFRQALEHYRHAIAIDPAYAPAYAGQAMAYIELGSWASSQPPGVVHADARVAALAALERDPSLAEAHIALARVRHLFEWDWDGADEEFRRGIELNPRVTHALGMYGNYLMSMGRFSEAAEIARQAIERDPLWYDGNMWLGWALDHMGRDSEALVEYERALELAPDDPNILLELSQFHGERGNVDKAIDYALRAEGRLGVAAPPAWLGRLGYNYGIAKRPDDARRVLNHLQSRAQDGYVPPTCPAVIRAALGETAQAVDLLERAYEQRDVIMVWIKVRHQFDTLRAHPKFKDLLRRMKFPS